MNIYPIMDTGQGGMDANDWTEVSEMNLLFNTGICLLYASKFSNYPHENTHALTFIWGRVHIFCYVHFMECIVGYLFS